MSNFLWVKTQRREELLNALDKIPEIGRKSKSALLEMALEEFVLKHGKSKNPQTTITLFDNENILAIPSGFADLNDWKKFYKLIDKDSYSNWDKHLNTINNLHNKKLRDFA